MLIEDETWRHRKTWTMRHTISVMETIGPPRSQDKCTYVTKCYNLPDGYAVSQFLVDVGITWGVL
jgi:hypothetical protein